MKEMRVMKKSWNKQLKEHPVDELALVSHPEVVISSSVLDRLNRKVLLIIDQEPKEVNEKPEVRFE